MTARPSRENFSIQDPYFLDIETHPNWESIFGNRKPVKLEIGFGMGDTTFKMAQEMPYSNFLAIEVIT